MTTPSTQQQALTTGSLFFVTGKPCKRGHNTRRYASSGRCVECCKIADVHTIPVGTKSFAPVVRMPDGTLKVIGPYPSKAIAKQKLLETYIRLYGYVPNPLLIPE